MARFNNTIVTITDMTGGAVTWASAGSRDLKDPGRVHLLLLRVPVKSLPKGHGVWLRQVDVYVNGPGSGREAAVRGTSIQLACGSILFVM